MTDEELRSFCANLKDSVSKKQSVNKERLLIQSFGVVREIAKRKIGLYPFPVQLLAGIYLTKRLVAEMKTGEGKTLTAIMPVYYNYLLGHSTHIVTVNEYLAGRDAK